MNRVWVRSLPRRSPRVVRRSLFLDLPLLLRLDARELCDVTKHRLVLAQLPARAPCRYRQ